MRFLLVVLAVLAFSSSTMGRDAGFACYLNLKNGTPHEILIAYRKLIEYVGSLPPDESEQMLEKLVKAPFEVEVLSSETAQLKQAFNQLRALTSRHEMKDEDFKEIVRKTMREREKERSTRDDSIRRTKVIVDQRVVAHGAKNPGDIHLFGKNYLWRFTERLEVRDEHYKILKTVPFLGEFNAQGQSFFEGRLAASDSNGNVFVVDADTASVKKIFSSHEQVRSLSLFDDGKKLAVGGPSGLRIFDVVSGVELGMVKFSGMTGLHINAVRFSPDGEFVLFATNDWVGYEHLAVRDPSDPFLYKSIAQFHDKDKIRDIVFVSGKAYFISETQLLGFENQALKSLWSAPEEGYGISLSPGGNRFAWINSKSQELLIYLRKGEVFEKEHSIGLVEFKKTFDDWHTSLSEVLFSPDEKTLLLRMWNNSGHFTFSVPLSTLDTGPHGL